MIQNKTVLAIITARGASKRLPRKNVLELAGKPLIAWTITEAKSSKYIDRLILSSEDEEIIEVAKKWGCEVPFIRPVELAQDETSSMDVIFHALDTISEKYDYVVLLQPTSPLRTTQDIDACIEKCIQKDAPACVSVTEPNKNPYWMFTLKADETITPLITNNYNLQRRQELPKAYALNGAVYVADSLWLAKNKSFLTKDTIVYIMPNERSIDIDCKLDFIITTSLFRK
ncbi:acylneuraminate cytidylyltransferase [Achromatium sp. WMS3]|nr:acylneuraminate cytidylyltransferase [Achromatium sp. WMS3]